MLTAGAALVGVAVAAARSGSSTSYGATYIPRIDEIRLSPSALVWLGLLSLASGLVVGLIPAIHCSRLRLDRALASGGRSGTDGPAARQLRRGLVAD